ncbi:MAG: leucine-rich repeat protein, partial [Oscillospiraceae bacterium]|nr:leucine-rich repeat protein [Oscillospiraceae bacterium]
MYCKSCGKNIEDDSAFCRFCGAGQAVETVEAAEAVEIVETVENVNEDDFVIKKGTLIEYKGKSGNVVVPDSVTGIGSWAFECCTSLTSITIPDSVTRIGDMAFKGCKSLTGVTLPD